MQARFEPNVIDSGTVTRQLALGRRFLLCKVTQPVSLTINNALHYTTQPAASQKQTAWHTHCTYPPQKPPSHMLPRLLALDSATLLLEAEEDGRCGRTRPASGSVRLTAPPPPPAGVWGWETAGPEGSSS